MTLRTACLALLALFGSGAALAADGVVTSTLATPGFRIVHTPEAKAAAKGLAAEVEEARATFRSRLGRDWPGVTEIRVGMGRAQLEALAETGRAPPSWAEALAYPDLNVVLLDARSLASDRGETTLIHELCHVALGQLGSGFPRWFHEGLAQQLSGELPSLERYATLFRGVQQGRIFDFEDLSTDWPKRPLDVELAYAQSASFVAFLLDRHRPEELGQLLDDVARGEHFDTAFARAFKASVWVEEMQWRKGLPSRYGWLPASTLGALLWISAALLCVVGFVFRRRAMARRLQAMAEEEALEQATFEGASSAPFPPEGALPGFHALEDDPPSEPGSGRPEKRTLH